MVGGSVSHSMGRFRQTFLSHCHLPKALHSLTLTQDVVELVQVVLPRKDGPVRQHLSQNAAHRPNIDGLGVTLERHGGKKRSHDLGLSGSSLLFGLCSQSQLTRMPFSLFTAASLMK